MVDFFFSLKDHGITILTFFCSFCFHSKITESPSSYGQVTPSECKLHIGCAWVAAPDLFGSLRCSFVTAVTPSVCMPVCGYVSQVRSEPDRLGQTRINPELQSDHTHWLFELQRQPFNRKSVHPFTGNVTFAFRLTFAHDVVLSLLAL